MAGTASITIVGLGPGDGQWLTRRAWEVLSAAELVYLRTARHPAVADLPAGTKLTSFDPIYESATDFEQVYRQITNEILDLAENGVVYAVPGHPNIGESTVTAIIKAAQARNIPVTIIPGLSFVEPLLTAIGVDGLDGLQLFDGLELAGYNYPPINPDIPLLLGQVYNRMLANELKLTLMAVYPPEQPVLFVHAAGTAEEVVEKIFLYQIDRSEHIGHLSSLYVQPLAVAGSLSALAEAVAVLRGPNGCPWDQEQTTQSMRQGFLEEVGEVLDALDQNDSEALREELGDVLLHLVMQAQMASEEEIFRLSEVVGGIYAKIKRRHPHVWGNWQVADSREVLVNWERLKEAERAEKPPTSVLDNIPFSLPALARSQKIQGRVEKVGFDWPNVQGVVEKLEEEIEELKQATTPAGYTAELGDLLFAAVNWGRWLGVDAESALREANLRFSNRFQYIEKLARERHVTLADLDLPALEGLWQEAKKREIEA